MESRGDQSTEWPLGRRHAIDVKRLRIPGEGEVLDRALAEGQSRRCGKTAARVKILEPRAPPSSSLPARRRFRPWGGDALGCPPRPESPGFQGKARGHSPPATAPCEQSDKGDSAALPAGLATRHTGRRSDPPIEHVAHDHVGAAAALDPSDHMDQHSPRRRWSAGGRHLIGIGAPGRRRQAGQSRASASSRPAVWRRAARSG